MRKNFEERENFSCFVVYEKKGRCFSPLAQKEKFRPQQSRLYTDKGDKIYYKVCTNLHKFFHKYITKIPSEFFVGKSIIATIKLQAVKLQLRHPAHIKEQNKKGANFKEKVKVTNISFLPA
jgi:hypothetical protein